MFELLDYASLFTVSIILPKQQLSASVSCCKDEQWAFWSPVFSKRRGVKCKM